MSKLFCFILSFFIVINMLSSLAIADETNILPKYGLIEKSESEKKVDEKFIASVKEHYKGNLTKAAEDIALSGWGYLRQNDTIGAMKRFNQAWLLDNKNGTALWGMAIAEQKKALPTSIATSMELFAEAEQYKKEDIDFAVDYARAMSFRAIQLKDITFLRNTLNKYSEISLKAPNHTLNFQNWAITLYQIGDYKQSWEKIKLAEATPRKSEIDKRFLEALESKMPRSETNK
jgi:hypothetical protein